MGDVPGFEQIQPGARLRGLVPSAVAEVVQVSRYDANSLNVVFRADGRVDERLVYRGEEAGFELVQQGRGLPGGFWRMVLPQFRDLRWIDRFDFIRTQIYLRISTVYLRYEFCLAARNE